MDYSLLLSLKMAMNCKLYGCRGVSEHVRKFSWISKNFVSRIFFLWQCVNALSNIWFILAYLFDLFGLFFIHNQSRSFWYLGIFSHTIIFESLLNFLFASFSSYWKRSVSKDISFRADFSLGNVCLRPYYSSF